jgi:hypothetical protein
MKSKLNLHKLSPKMQANIKDGLLLSVAAGGAYGIFGILGTKLFSRNELEHMSESVEMEETQDNMMDDTEGCLVIESDVEVIESDNNVSFAEAFTNAREELGPGGFFNYNGKSYTTFYKEELDNMPKEELEEVSNEIGNELADGEVIDVITDESREVVSIADLDEQPIELLEPLSDPNYENNEEIILEDQDGGLPEEIVYEEDLDGFTESQMDSTEERELAASDSEDISISSEDFQDPLFDGIGLAEESSSASNYSSDVVIAFDEFDDPLFEGIPTTESSNSTYQDVVVDTESYDNDFSYDEEILITSEDLMDDFNDPLFEGSFEPMESTPVYEPVAYTDQDIEKVGITAADGLDEFEDFSDIGNIDEFSDLDFRTDDIIE